MRCDGCDEECGDANPIMDRLGVHVEVGRDFAVPVSDDLHFVETVFEGVFVVGSEGRFKKGLRREMNNLRSVVGLGEVDQMVDFLFKDLVEIVLFTMPQISIVFQSVLWCLSTNANKNKKKTTTNTPRTTSKAYAPSKYSHSHSSPQN